MPLCASPRAQQAITFTLSRPGHRTLSKLLPNWVVTKALARRDPCRVIASGRMRHIACKDGELNAKIVSNAAWPTKWRGGRIVDAYEGKGDPAECDNSRTILLADHAGKGLACQVKDKVEPEYGANVPDNQYGAVAGRGTDFASHIISSAIAAASLSQWSIFILFVDLVKAFDRVIRQIAYGWGPNPSDEQSGAPPRAWCL